MILFYIEFKNMQNNIVCCLGIKLMLQKHKHTQGDDKRPIHIENGHF